MAGGCTTAADEPVAGVTIGEVIAEELLGNGLDIATYQSNEQQQANYAHCEVNWHARIIAHLKEGINHLFRTRLDRYFEKNRSMVLCYRRRPVILQSLLIFVIFFKHFLSKYTHTFNHRSTLIVVELQLLQPMASLLCDVVWLEGTI